MSCSSSCVPLVSCATSCPDQLRRSQTNQKSMSYAVGLHSPTTRVGHVIVMLQSCDLFVGVREDDQGKRLVDVLNSKDKFKNAFLVCSCTVTSFSVWLHLLGAMNIIKNFIHN